MIIFYHSDADGKCAASIVNKKIQRDKLYLTNQRVEYIEMDYAKPVPLNLIQENEHIWVVDFSFKPEVMTEVFKKTRNIVWIDHHKTCENYDYGRTLDGLRDFKEKGLSGCELTWMHCFVDNPIPNTVELLGDYDSWRLKLPSVFEYYEGLKLEDTSPQSQVWELLLGDDVAKRTNFMVEIITRGHAAIMYRDSYCSDILKSFGYETEIDGVKAYTANLYRFGSMMFGKKIKEYPVCIAYIYDGKKFTVSLYSESVDVSEIAKKFSGGGHSGAAGFVCEKLPFERK